ncbi:MAG: PfkB family carbohydrate kinase, partial [Actinomycetota bacterium]
MRRPGWRAGRDAGLASWARQLPVVASVIMGGQANLAGRGQDRPLICVLGDAHIDVVVSPDGPFELETDTRARVTVAVGGQAANVAAWVAALSGTARLIAARAGDLAGSLVAAELASRGVELVGPVLAGRTGTVVCMSEGGGTRSMLTDRGVGPGLDASAFQPAWLDGCSWLHLPAYSLVAEPV